MNPLASINGKAVVMSQQEFLQRYPNGKIPRNSPGYNKTFICRRGCNTRTSTYTEEFLWEDVYSAKKNGVADLLELVRSGTRSTRRRRNRDDQLLESDYATTYQDRGDDYPSDDGVPRTVSTPRKKQKTTRVITPSNRR